VARHCKAGFDVVLIGHRGHPEVEGTMGQCAADGGRMHLVEDIDDVAALRIARPDKVAYVTQTTLSVDDTSRIIAALRARFPNITGPKKSDICYATQNRQDAVRDLAAGRPGAGGGLRHQLQLQPAARAGREAGQARLSHRRRRRHPPRMARRRPRRRPHRRRLGTGAAGGAGDRSGCGNGAPATVEEQSGIRENVTFALPKELQPSRRRRASLTRHDAMLSVTTGNEPHDRGRHLQHRHPHHRRRRHRPDDRP
jgi:4-hydroxy-3-methylbut-2-enyl diphosphate reductase